VSHFMMMEKLYTEDLTPFPDEPRETSVQCAVVPTNPYRGKTAFTGQLKIARTIQKHSAHIFHEDTHYCQAQRRVTKEICIMFKLAFDQENRNMVFTFDLSDFFVCVESDDKAKIPFGDPGRAIDSNARPHGRILAGIDNTTENDAAPKTKIADALDRSYHVGSISPSVNLFQAIPSRLDESWVGGGVKVTLNDSVFEGSNGMKHYAELALQVLQIAAQRQGTHNSKCIHQFNQLNEDDKEKLLKYVPAVVFINHDGGGRPQEHIAQKHDSIGSICGDPSAAYTCQQPQCPWRLMDK
jgi:hypothetical protein